MRTLGPALLGGALVLALLAGNAPAGPLPETATDEFSSLPQIAADELAQQRGGTETYEVGDYLGNETVFNTPLTGDVSGNITTGMISGNTLSNVSGISSVMYNTGANVVMNSSIQLNLNLK